MPGSADSMLRQLRQAARIQQRPDGSDYWSLTHEDVASLCKKLSLSRKKLQLLALDHGITPECYARNQQTLSCSDQARLLRSSVCIAGLGGLGGGVCEILARLGVGHLLLIDPDVFSESNCNRQLLCTTKNLGHNKARAAARRISQINPAVTVRAITAAIGPENAQEILSSADLAVDCLDSIAARLQLEAACAAVSRPLVSAAVGGTCCQIIFCPPGAGRLAAIYGSRSQGMEASHGTLPQTAMLAAALQSAEVSRLLLGKTAALARHLLFADCNDLSFCEIDLEQA